MLFPCGNVHLHEVGNITTECYEITEFSSQLLQVNCKLFDILNDYNQ